MRRICQLLVLLLCAGLKVKSQEIRDLDTFRLRNGLKVCLLHYSGVRAIELKLVFNGGRLNESSCQVGYSELIQQLLAEKLTEQSSVALRREVTVTGELQGGRTILSGSFFSNELQKEIAVFSTTLWRMAFSQQQLDKAVSLIGERYLPENLKAQYLAGIYTDKILFGEKNPLGRRYCQYVLQKVTAHELREFFIRNYTPDRSILLIGGNLDVVAAKRMVTKHFSRWRPAQKQKKRGAKINVVKIPKFRNREIHFIHRTGEKQIMLGLLRAAPEPGSVPYEEIRSACAFFDHFLKRELKAANAKQRVSMMPTTLRDGFMQTNFFLDPEDLYTVVTHFESALQILQKYSITEADLSMAVFDSRNDGVTRGILDQVLESGALQSNGIVSYRQLNRVSVQQLQHLIKKYFDPSFKVIVLGDEQRVAAQLEVWGKRVTRYQDSYLQSCDEDCIEKFRKKWRKKRKKCCFKCFMRGWCPCMYSPERLQ